MPGLVKIGLTTNAPLKRAGELYTTGVPAPFEVARTWRVPAPELGAIETEIHTLLQQYRYNRYREFFEIEQEEAIDLVGAYIKRRVGSSPAADLSRLAVYGLIAFVVMAFGSMIIFI